MVSLGVSEDLEGRDNSRHAAARRQTMPSRLTELVLTRRPGQAILLWTRSGLIRIKQLTRGRVSIQAPSDVKILREEVAEEEPEKLGRQ